MSELKKLEDKLRAEHSEILAKSAGLRAKRDELVKSIQPVEAQIRELNKSIREIERPRRQEIGRELVQIVKAKKRSAPETPKE